jgi:hypothetical protein
MTEALTTKKAFELYQCQDCETGQECNYNCVECVTCSVICSECCGRVWFFGNANGSPETFVCPYCKEESLNQFHNYKKGEA